MRKLRADLVEHVGGKPSATQRALIDRAAWLSLHVLQMDARFSEREGSPSERDGRQYLAWSNSLARTLVAIGIKPAAAATLSLREHLARREAEAAA